MRQIALGILLTGLISTSAFAQGPAAATLRTDGALEGLSDSTSTFTASLERSLRLSPTPAAPVRQAASGEPQVSVSVGADFPSVYFFRGFRQESDPALTFQPYVTLGATVGEASLSFGTWNSIHTGSLEDALDGSWYESDLFASVGYGPITATYTAYTYPNIDDSAVHELMIAGTFDDSESAFPLAPSVAVAFEFAKPAGLDKGIYLELGVTPEVPMADDAPVSISVPVKLGLSLKDYYGEDAFGYFSAGVNVSVPVNDMFEVHGGVTVLALSDYLQLINNGDRGQVIGSVGFGLSF